jgi:3',5'-cyclic AMP phosphodiesterase CpdA
MPGHLPPLSRRRFLTGLTASLSLLPLSGQLWAEGKEDERWILFSDIHVAADRATEARGVKMAANLERAVREASAMAKQSAGVFINGDLAYNTGEPGDYATVAELLEPLRKLGQSVHFTLGNHDQRDNIQKGVPVTGEGHAAVMDKFVSVVKGAHANWFLLDSLEQTNKTPGILGETQLGWLAKELDAHKDKPAIVMVHHNPDTNEKRSGLKDTEKLWEVLAPRKQVKALIFGHTHVWSVKAHESGIHQVNLPTVAYVFNQAQPNGWVDATLKADTLTLRLNAFDEKHPEHGKVKALKWRAA